MNDKKCNYWQVIIYTCNVIGEKVGSGKMCLWCNDRSKIFHSVKATQQHMIDKGHCMLYHDGDAAYEYADFYDYS